MKKRQLETREKFIHRDISWLKFNERVMEEALESDNPLMERCKFLAIFVNNLDEFFMVRVAGLRRLIASQYNKKDVFGYYPQELFAEIRSRIDELVKRLYEIYRSKLTKELEKSRILINDPKALNAVQKKFVKRYFERNLFPIITPLAVDQGHPFPVLASKTLAFAVFLERKGEKHLAVITVPRNVPRLVRLPSERDEYSFILIDRIIEEHLGNFFRGFKVVSASRFRVIRDSELSMSEEYTADLLKAIEEELKNRPKAQVVHMEIEKGCDTELLEALCENIEFPLEEVTAIDGDFDLTYCFELMGQVKEGDLYYRGFVPAKVPYENIFDRIKEGDFLLHPPFQSFYATVDLIRTAARDENVLAIKMTLYRASEDSAIVEALQEAAKNRKQVTVLVEIKARFDEERNINWVRQLEVAGCHVVYGIAGMKIHSKITLVVRKEEGRIRRYVHLSTGNYNEKTAKIYTDIGYFTANDDFARDISDVFNVITGYSLPARWKRIISSPFDLREYFFELIDGEIECQKKYKNGLIFAKMNSLEDPKIIEKLYQASQAGVTVRLIVRGICCLLSGIRGLSETIEVRSIVGRFLEHSRIFTFHNNGEARVFLSSADWMQRNFDRRIELLFEILKQDLKDRLLDLMEIYWQDNVKARVLQPDGTYARPGCAGEKMNSQESLVQLYAG